MKILYRIVIGILICNSSHGVDYSIDNIDLLNFTEKIVGFSRKPLIGNYGYNSADGEAKVDVLVKEGGFLLSLNEKAVFSGSMKNNCYVDSVAWSDEGRLLLMIWKASDKGASPYCVVDSNFKGQPTSVTREVRYKGLNLFRFLKAEKNRFVAELNIGIGQFKYAEASVIPDQLRIAAKGNLDYPNVIRVGEESGEQRSVPE